MFQARVRIELLFAAGVLGGSYWFFVPGVWPYALCLLLFAAVWLHRLDSIALVFSLLLGAGAAYLHSSHVADSRHYSHYLPVRNVYLDGGLLEITDRRLSRADDFSGLRMVSAEMLQPMHGTVLLSLPAENAPRLQYGQRWKISGVLQLPEERFARYAAANGADRILRGYSFVFQSENIGVGWWITRIRDCVLRQSLTNVKDPENRSLIAALFFGVTGGVDREAKESFLQSGILHLFSVSGMHVAVLAGVLMVFLRLFPFRLRYVLLVVLIFLYVFSTGASAPALRAFWMILVWSVLRLSFRYMPVFHVLALTAGILVLSESALVFNAGFYYSFVITGALLLLAERTRGGVALWKEATFFMAGYRLKAQSQWQWRIPVAVFLSFAACVTAFLAGAAISLYSQRLFLPGSILTNLMLLILLPLLFPLLLAKLTLGAVFPIFDVWIGSMLDGCFHLLRGVVDFSCEYWHFLMQCQPTLTESVLFSIACLLLIGGSRMWRYGAGAVVGGLLSWWFLQPKWMAPVMIVGLVGGELPFAAVVEPAESLAVVMNVPGYAGADYLLEALQSRGITEIEELHFSVPRAAAARQLDKLLAKIPCRKVIIPKLDGRANVFAAQLEGSPRFWKDSTPSTGKIIEGNTNFSFAYFNPGSKLKTILKLTGTDAGYLAEIRTGTACDVRLLRFSNTLESWTHELR